MAINVYLMTHNVIQTKNGITISVNMNVKNHWNNVKKFIFASEWDKHLKYFTEINTGNLILICPDIEIKQCNTNN